MELQKRKRGRPTLGEKPMTNSEHAAKSRAKAREKRKAQEQALAEKGYRLVELPIKDDELSALEQIAKQTGKSLTQILRLATYKGLMAIKDKVEAKAEQKLNRKRSFLAKLDIDASNITEMEMDSHLIDWAWQNDQELYEQLMQTAPTIPHEDLGLTSKKEDS